MADNLARVPLAVGFLGPGAIGQALLRQLAKQVTAPVHPQETLPNRRASATHLGALALPMALLGMRIQESPPSAQP